MMEVAQCWWNFSGIVKRMEVLNEKFCGYVRNQDLIMLSSFSIHLAFMKQIL